MPLYIRLERAIVVVQVKTTFLINKKSLMKAKGFKNVDLVKVFVYEALGLKSG